MGLALCVMMALALGAALEGRRGPSKSRFGARFCQVRDRPDLGKALIRAPPDAVRLQSAGGEPPRHANAPEIPHSASASTRLKIQFDFLGEYNKYFS